MVLANMLSTRVQASQLTNGITENFIDKRLVLLLQDNFLVLVLQWSGADQYASLVSSKRIEQWKLYFLKQRAQLK